MKKFFLLFLLLSSALFISCSQKTTQVTNDVVIPKISGVVGWLTGQHQSADYP